MEDQPVVGIKALEVIDEQRNRIDFLRAREICEGITRHCVEEKPWPPEWDDELNYITGQLWKRNVEGGVEQSCC